MDKELVSEMNSVDMSISEQIDIDKIMNMDKERRDIILRLLKSNGFHSEITNTLRYMGVIDDTRNVVIDKIIK